MARTTRAVGTLALVVAAAGCGQPQATGTVRQGLGDTACDVNGCISLGALASAIAGLLNSDGGVNGYVIMAGNESLTGGQARTATDAPPGGLPMATTLQANIASVSKIVTTVAAVQSLDRQGLVLDSPVAPYLWRGWTLGPGMASLTFRQLLTHTSGFRNNAGDCCPTPGCNSRYVDCGGDRTDYATLQTVIATGVDSGNVGQACYDNCNFALFRELLPFINGQTYVSSDGDAATWSANYYQTYVNANVFAPLGIGARQCAPPSGVDILAYPNPAGTTPGTDFLGWSDLNCGGGGWYLTAQDLETIGADLAGGYTLLTPHQKQLMATPLGWDNTVSAPCAGGGPCKNGGLGAPPNGAISSYLGIVKCAPVVAIVNSSLPPYYQNGGNIIQLVADAYSSLAPVSGTPACCDGTAPCGGVCCDGGTTCNGAGACVPCGGVNQPCCHGTYPACVAGATCNGFGSCVEAGCGAVNQPCCTNVSPVCSGELSCDAGGYCVCGGTGQSCSDNGQCCSQNCYAGTCQCIGLGGLCYGGAECCGSNVCSNGVCTVYTPPGTCNGVRRPTRSCSAGWHCCGSDGWECGLCQ